VRRTYREDAGGRRIIGRGVHAVEHQPLDWLERRGRAVGYRLPVLGEGLARGNRAVEIDAVAPQRQILGTNAADQRQPRRELQPVLDRDRDVVELAVTVIRLRD